MASLTIENYVKEIYQICLRSNGKPAATGHVAATLGVSPGTVTSMLKTLSETELATYTPYEGVELTSTGKALALRVLRRHRLIELFLVNTLGFTWDEVHEEAENLEHAVSDLLVDRIDNFLGYPENDPHGDPIPKADGTVINRDSRSLDQWEIGSPFRLVRVLDQTSEFLRYLSDTGISLGIEGRILGKTLAAGVITIQFNGSETTLAKGAAEKLLVSAP